MTRSTTTPNPSHRAAALPAVVVGDAAIPVSQGFDLGAEHLRIHEQAVGEHDGLIARAVLLVIECGTVDFDGRHDASELIGPPRSPAGPR